MKQNGVFGKKVSSNELVLVDFLNGTINSGETEHYVIKNNCVYNKTKCGKIFLFYKEENNIFYRFSGNNKSSTRKILPLIGDNLSLYLMHKEITYPKIRKDVFNLVDVSDMLGSMIYIYLEYDYYKVILDSGHDFMDILFKQVKEFDGEDILFSEEMTKNIKKYTDSKNHPDYDWVSHWRDDLPQINIPDACLELKPENLKRAYKINSLIS